MKIKTSSFVITNRNIISFSIILAFIFSQNLFSSMRRDCSFRGTINNKPALSYQCEKQNTSNENYLLLKVRDEKYLYDFELSGVDDIDRGQYTLAVLANKKGKFKRYLSSFKASYIKKNNNQVNLEDVSVNARSRGSKLLLVEGDFKWTDVTNSQKICFACNCNE